MFYIYIFHDSIPSLGCIPIQKTKSVDQIKLNKNSTQRHISRCVKPPTTCGPARHCSESQYQIVLRHVPKSGEWHPSNCPEHVLNVSFHTPKCQACLDAAQAAEEAERARQEQERGRLEFIFRNDAHPDRLNYVFQELEQFCDALDLPPNVSVFAQRIFRIMDNATEAGFDGVHEMRHGNVLATSLRAACLFCDMPVPDDRIADLVGADMVGYRRANDALIELLRYFTEHDFDAIQIVRAVSLD